MEAFAEEGGVTEAEAAEAAAAAGGENFAGCKSLVSGGEFSVSSSLSLSLLL